MTGNSLSIPGIRIAVLIFSLTGLLSIAQSPSPQKPPAKKAIGQPLLGDADLAAALDLDEPGLEKVRAAVSASNFAAAKQAYLDYRRTAAPARWKVMPADEPKSAAAADDPAGDEIVGHIIRNHYGFNPKVGDMGRDFNWLFNPVARTDPHYSDEWTYCAISRTQFWEPLADAYWKTLDEKYAREWVAQLQDFAVKNPIEHEPTGGDPSLWRTIDAGIRMHESWPYAYEHFVDSPSFTPEANWLFLNEIHTHGTRLATGLSDPKRSGNWVTTECFGLYTLAVLFPELKESAGWQALAMERMTNEVQRVVPPDGFECELSPDYHTVALGGFAGIYQLAKLNNLPVPDLFRDRILAMYRAMVTVMQQNGKIVGTNDSMEMNVIPLAQAGARLGDDPLLEWAATGGKSGTPPPLSAMLPYAGFYVMRGGWDPKDLFLFFRGGPTGTSHQHEDMNEIVLRAYGHTFLADPGNYLYDHSEMRRYIINSASHNTIMVDGKWQHRGPSHFPAVDAVKNPWITTPFFDFVSATYDAGYQENDYDGSKEFAPQKWIGTPDKSVSHTRRVLYLKPGYALVLDTLDGTGDHVFDAHFHLNATTSRIDPNTQAVYASDKSGPTLALFPLDRDNLEAELITGQKSPMLGWSGENHQPLPTLRYRKKQAAPAIFSTFLYPTPSPAPELSYEDLTPGDGLWGRRLQTGVEQIEVVIAKDGASHPISVHEKDSSPVTAQAAGLVLRRPVAGAGLLAGGWKMQAYDDGTLQFSIDAPGTFAASEEGGHLLMFNPSSGPITLSLKKPYSRNVTLPAGVWEEIGDKGETPATAPVLTGVVTNP